MENPQCNVVPRRYAVHELYNVHVPSMHVLSLYKLYGKFEMTYSHPFDLLGFPSTTQDQPCQPQVAALYVQYPRSNFAWLLAVGR